MVLFITFIVATILEGVVIMLTLRSYLHDVCDEEDETCDTDRAWVWYYLLEIAIYVLFIAFKIYFGSVIWRFYVELRDENVVKREDGTEVHIETAPHPVFGDLTAA